MSSRDFITLVSGVPRSGTSMMMQSLAAGGMTVLTDSLRTPDPDNPRGYYEYEPVKQLRRESSWLADAEGQAIKIIYRHLYDIPTGHAYRVVFMRRDLSEVVASQEAMLQRQGKARGSLPPEELVEIFTNELARLEAWLANQSQFKILNVDYRAVLRDPRQELDRVNDFLGGELNLDAMVSAVDPELYRHRHAAE